jgi:branched-chain amino acid transport system permease protein
VSSYTERWMLILGITFILFVRFAPGGIVGAVRASLGRALSAVRGGR